MPMEIEVAIEPRKLQAALDAAVHACDGLDGVRDCVHVRARATTGCRARAGQALTSAEARAMDKIWAGS